jgi:hypothetical protein
MKISSYSRHPKGVVTLVSTVVICAFLLTLATIQYRAAIRNLEGQKSTQLSIDYAAREQAFLRSVVTLTPAYAANTMANGSNGGATDTNASFASMYNEAIGWSDVWARDAQTETALQQWSANYRNGNTGDTNQTTAPTVRDFIGAVTASGATDGDLAAGYTPSAALNVQRTGQNYPVTFTNARGSSDTLSTSYPLLSSDLEVTTNAGFGFDYSATTPYPDIHFGYGTPGQDFIARHNWWQLFLHPQSRDAAATGQNNGFNNSEWVLSLYEVPAQLAISSAAFTNIGQINGTDWSDSITVTGNIYAKEADLQGSTIDGLATTKGATITAGNVSGQGNFNQANIDAFEAANPQAFFPISQASDFARSLFLPINPGAEFFDLYAAANPAANLRLSAQSWIEYSRGCRQCVMQAIVTATEESDGGVGQTPTVVRLTYLTDANGNTAFYDFTGAELPNASTGVEPFYISTNSTVNGNVPTLAVDVGALLDWLDSDTGGNLDAAGVRRNKSLVVNADYTVNGITEPDPDPSTAPVVVELAGADDLSAVDEGFSLVTNYPLFILSDVNTVQVGANFPPLSLFAPSIRYGQTGDSRTVTLTGAVASLRQTGAADVLDLKATDNNAAVNAQIVADLRPITDIAQLPPVNLMNWLVVVQKKRD